MNENLESILEKVQRDFDFVGTITDNKTGKTSEYVNYSTTVQLMPSWIEQVHVRFPSFSVANLYSDYFIIGFNETK